MPAFEVSARTLQFFKNANKVYLDFLEPFATPGNLAVREERMKISSFNESLSQKIKRLRQIKEADWMWFPVDFGNEELQILRSTLPLLKCKCETEIDENKSAGAPMQASESLQNTILEIDKLLASPIFANVIEYNLIEGNYVPKKNQESSGSTIINATIHNRDGVVAVGKDIKIQQNFNQLDQLLEELIRESEKSRLQQGAKEEIEGFARAIQSQLGTKKPNNTIIKTAINGIKALATMDGLIGVVEKISQFLTTHNLMVNQIGI